MELFFEVFVAAMAVFGLWCALQLLAQSLLGSRAVGTVIEVFDKETAARLPSLLEQARHAPFEQRRAPIVVLYGAELCLEYGAPGAAEQELIAHFGAQWYMVQPKAKETNAGKTGE